MATRELASVRFALNTVVVGPVCACTITWRQTPPGIFKLVELVAPEAVVTVRLN